MTRDDHLVEGLKSDYRKLELDNKTKAMFDYAVKLTKKPHSVEDADIETLRENGCSDDEILDVCQITSYFNFVNRMAEGLGVKLEDQ